jgi:DNA-binding helix-hairpin-helix protein with protein kinase domain
MVDYPRLVAKVFHRPTALHQEKIERLRALAPPATIGADGHADVAWPVDLLFEDEGQTTFRGYLMWRLDGAPLAELYNPAAAPAYVTPQLRLMWAASLLSTLSELHALKFVLGDLNPDNVLGRQDGRTSIIDLDSAQQLLPTGRVLRCEVGIEEWLPPEMHRVHADWKTAERTVQQDVWGALTLAFHCLVDGHHPFQGVYEGPGPIPGLAERVRRGLFPYSGQHGEVRPPPSAIGWHLLPRTLRRLMVQCFEDGQADPLRRPSVAQAAREMAASAARYNHRTAQVRRFLLLFLGGRTPRAWLLARALADVCRRAVVAHRRLAGWGVVGMLVLVVLGVLSVRLLSRTAPARPASPAAVESGLPLPTPPLWKRLLEEAPDW